MKSAFCPRVTPPALEAFLSKQQLCSKCSTSCQFRLPHKQAPAVTMGAVRKRYQPRSPVSAPWRLCLLPHERLCLGEVPRKGYGATGVAPCPQAGWGENCYATCKTQSWENSFGNGSPFVTSQAQGTSCLWEAAVTPAGGWVQGGNGQSSSVTAGSEAAVEAAVSTCCRWKCLSQGHSKALRFLQVPFFRSMKSYAEQKGNVCSRSA